MTVKELKDKARSFGLAAEIILNNAKYRGFNDWMYDFVTLDESRGITETNVVKFYFVSGVHTISHPVNMVVLGHSPEKVIGEFHKEVIE
ncbi:hypothetical protein [Aeromonas phage AS-zj]|uniref:Uncharacterized protein n=3 Tax=Caudoviricetes TaxID=2731619 RepID=A0A291LD72_9CAUD|nr:hypothetical protein HWB28_gp320 [Aeromonas phage AS-zj]ASU00232.1 hypothetical protein [Aeromonas phage AS-zj]ATI17362.1 hypothetical protein [Aeromonas phage AS-szw]QMV29051.1 hypothetical protein AP1_0344 [Aeromonas phage AP1]UKM62840.1 hypothetical protein P19_0352 [Aeromonas phage P19]